MERAMRDYLLDTNILSYWYDTIRPEHPRVVRAVDSARQPDPKTGYVARFLVSVVALGELEFGHRANPNADLTKQTEYVKFVREQCPESLELTEHVAAQYGLMRAWLFNNCGRTTSRTTPRRAEQIVVPDTGESLGIDENDLWIAAQAMTHDLILVTHDRRGNLGKVLSQFSPTLRVEDWAS
jgi:predicted nucleic acid-binding protein